MTASHFSPPSPGVWLVEPRWIEQTSLQLPQLIAAKDAPGREPVPHVAESARVAGGRRYRIVGRTAIIPILGLIEQRQSLLGWLSGGTTTESILAGYTAALADSSVDSIVFEVDSPGGNYPGIPELANDIFSLRGRKPTVAVASPTAASGALWIASAAERFYVQPSGQVGSIGAITIHIEQSRALDAAGLTVTVIRSPQRKANVNPYEPLPKAAKNELQSDVERITKEFQAAVARHRGVTPDVVASRFGRGGMLWSDRAALVRLVDGVRTLRQVVTELQSSSPAGGSRSRSRLGMTVLERHRRQEEFRELVARRRHVKSLERLERN